MKERNSLDSYRCLCRKSFTVKIESLLKYTAIGNNFEDPYVLTSVFKNESRESTNFRARFIVCDIEEAYVSGDF